MGRSIVGSGTNLASYSMIKEWLQRERGWADTVTLDMVAGLSSGVVSWYGKSYFFNCVASPHSDG